MAPMFCPTDLLSVGQCSGIVRVCPRLTAKIIIITQSNSNIADNIADSYIAAKI